MLEAPAQQPSPPPVVEGRGRNAAPFRSIHWPSVVQFGLSGVAAAGFWSSAAALLASGLIQSIEGTSSGILDPVSFMSAAGLVLLGLIAAVSTGLSGWRLVGRPPGFSLGRWEKLLRSSIMLMPIVLAGGAIAARLPDIAWLFLPAAHLLATGLPILFFVLNGRRGLPAGSAQRQWGLLGAGMGLSLVPILILEILAGVFVMGGIIWFVLRDQGVIQDKVNLIQHMIASRQEVALERITPIVLMILRRREVLAILLVYIAVLTPLIEETFKPIGLLFLNRRTLTPAAGFVAGMLSGAGFALIESLSQAVAGSGWALNAVGRLGAGLMHVTTTGLVGLGAGYALHGRPGKLAIYYILAVSLHGAWNTLAVLASVGLTPELRSGRGIPWELIGGASAAGLVVLVFLAYRLLSRTRRTLQP